MKLSKNAKIKVYVWSCGLNVMCVSKLAYFDPPPPLDKIFCNCFYFTSAIYFSICHVVN